MVGVKNRIYDHQKNNPNDIEGELNFHRDSSREPVRDICNFLYSLENGYIVIFTFRENLP
jgi:hypothetical protein